MRHKTLERNQKPKFENNEINKNVKIRFFTSKPEKFIFINFNFFSISALDVALRLNFDF